MVDGRGDLLEPLSRRRSKNAVRTEDEWAREVDRAALGRLGGGHDLSSLSRDASRPAVDKTDRVARAVL